MYALGSQGLSLGDLNMDFRLISDPGAERIIRLAFEFARDNAKEWVTVVTKAQRRQDDRRRLPRRRAPRRARLPGHPLGGLVQSTS